MLAIDQKVTRLIALTASDRIEEARTAAYLACQIIRKHGLIVVAELPRAGLDKPMQREPVSKEARAKTIFAKFGSACLDCHAEIYVGDRCVWLKGTGCWHPECAP